MLAIITISYQVVQLIEFIKVDFTNSESASYFLNRKFTYKEKTFLGLPRWRSGWESACQCGGYGFKPWSGRILHAAEQLGPCTTTAEPALWSPRATAAEACVPAACALQRERPLH